MYKVEKNRENTSKTFFIRFGFFNSSFKIREKRTKCFCFFNIFLHIFETMSKNDFYQQVYQVVRLVPKGRVTSYGAIANYLGVKRSARMVGYAMNCCHNEQPVVPAHRVVNRNGLLTGKNHFSSPTQMEELLKSEGVEVVDDQIKTFPMLFWDPEKELQ